MTFTSLSYLLFLPTVLLLYWALRSRRAQNILLLVASYIFYGWWDYRFCLLILLSSVVDYTVGRLLEKQESVRVRKLLVATSCVISLGILGFFKYYNFFAASLGYALGQVGITVHPETLNIILPAGVSFYTFQTMSYSIDVYRRRVKVCHSLPDFLLFVSFFVQLVAGPIERAGHLLAQIESARRFDVQEAKDGLRQILVGFFKKLVLAGAMGSIVDPYYANPANATGPELMVATVCFAFQIYYDFSAYSDIAIGTARLFGFSICRNFAYPYFSQTLGEFWHRWHMSLSTWFRDYLYIPLGGNRCGRVRHLANLLVTFVVSGLWHGASACFVVWGFVHGLLLVVETVTGTHGANATATPGGERDIPGWRTLLRMARTFIIVCFAWVFFRGGTLSNTLCILNAMGRDLFSVGAYVPVWHHVLVPNATALVLLVLFLVTEWMRRRDQHVLVFRSQPVFVRWMVYAGVILLVGLFGSTKPEEFIYFRF